MGGEGRHPKTKLTRDIQEADRRERIRQCCVNVVNYMIVHPDSAVQIWTSLESNLVGTSGEGSGSGGSGSSGAAADLASATPWMRMAR